MPMATRWSAASSEAGKAFGVETLGDIRHPLGATDFSTLLPRIQALKPDILCISNFGRDQQIALKQATDFGMKKQMKIIAPDPALHRPHRGRRRRRSRAWSAAPPITGASRTRSPSAKAFNDRFRKMYGGKVPSDYGALGYGGVRDAAGRRARTPAAPTPTR